MKLASLRSTAARQAAALISGTLFAQLVTFGASPILARLYGPEDFGIYGFFVSAAAIFASVASGRYDLAVVLPESEQESIFVAVLGVFVSACTVFFLAILIYLSGARLGTFVKNPLLDPWLWYLPIYIFLVSANQIFSQLNFRFAQFSIQARIRATQSLAAAGFGIALAVLDLGAGGLILGVLLAQLGVNVLQVFGGFRRYFPIVRAVKKQCLVEVAQRYRKFPFFQVPSTLIETITAYLPVFVLAPFYGAEAAGYFFMAQSIVRVPVTFVAKAVGDVFRQRASRQFNANGECRDLFNKTFSFLIAVSLPGFGVVCYFAPDFFAWVLGERWRVAGVYAQLMTLMFAMQFISSPLSSIFIVSQKLGYNLLMQITTFFVVGLAFYVGVVFFKDPVKTVALYSFAYAFRYSVQVFISYRLSKGGWS